MNGFALPALLERSDFRSAHACLKGMESARFADALDAANASMRRCFRALDALDSLGLGVAEDAAGLSVRTLVGFGVFRAVMGERFGRRRVPVVVATGHALDEVEQRAVHLALHRLSADEPLLAVDLDRSSSLHQLLVRLVMNERVFASASAISDAVRSVEAAIEGLSSAPDVLANQVRGLLVSTARMPSTGPAVHAALWVLTLRNACAPVATDEPTLGYADRRSSYGA